MFLFCMFFFFIVSSGCIRMQYAGIIQGSEDLSFSTLKMARKYLSPWFPGWFPIRKCFVRCLEIHQLIIRCKDYQCFVVHRSSCAVHLHMHFSTFFVLLLYTTALNSMSAKECILYIAYMCLTYTRYSRCTFYLKIVYSQKDFLCWKDPSSVIRLRSFRSNGWICQCRTDTSEICDSDCYLYEAVIRQRSNPMSGK